MKGKNISAFPLCTTKKKTITKFSGIEMMFIVCGARGIISQYTIHSLYRLRMHENLINCDFECIPRTNKIFHCQTNNTPPMRKKDKNKQRKREKKMSTMKYK